MHLKRVHRVLNELRRADSMASTLLFSSLLWFHLDINQMVLSYATES